MCGFSAAGTWNKYFGLWDQNLARCCILALMPLEEILSQLWRIFGGVQGAFLTSVDDSIRGGTDPSHVVDEDAHGSDIHLVKT